MKAVKRLVSIHSITLVATIHQPSASTFRLFDSLMLLLRGRVVFFGGRGATFFLACGCGILTHVNV
jgi:ATP-binding cassette, subfamily G (WHITE), member 2